MVWGRWDAKSPPARPQKQHPPRAQNRPGEAELAVGSLGCPRPRCVGKGGASPKPPQMEMGGFGIKSPRSQGHGHVPRVGGAGAAVPNRSRGPRGASSPRRLGGVPKTPPPSATPNGCSVSGSFCQSRAEPPPEPPSLPCCWGGTGVPSISGDPKTSPRGLGGRGQDEAVPDRSWGASGSPEPPPKPPSTWP